MVDDNDNRIYFPVDQQEQAQHKHSNTLLARDVYERVSNFLHESAQRVAKYEPNASSINSPIENLDNCRIHDAILVDGDRGTGKSTVLVNIKSYLKDYLIGRSETNISIDDYLWLKPIDPTLMESSDDLLLNTIVAALLSNSELKERLQQDSVMAEVFHKHLQDLSRALEGTQTHQNKFGIDKLRSFMGNQGLAEQIHRLYCLAARITAKKLVVLPIDDVDTSLNLAYDNIEVIRKYLASPYVLPIVSGNVDLYHEVIWRHFHGRLTKDCRLDERSLVEDAQELSRNYQQKVLPLPRQLRMPTIKGYFADDNIFLSCTNDKKLSLKFFYFWVESVINQQTSAGFNNYLNIPVNSIRDLVQLVDICSAQIEQLDSIERFGKNKVHRLTIMPLLTARAVDDFASEYGQAADKIDDQQRREGREQAYQSLEQALMHGDKKKYRQIAQGWQQEVLNRTEILLGWNHQLQEYLRHKKTGGQSYLVCKANEMWLNLALSTKDAKDTGFSVLNASLFNPLDTQYNSRFDLKYENRFERFVQESSNVNSYDTKLSLLNFPLVDSGKRSDKLRSIVENKWIEDSRVNDIFDIFYSLTHHRATSDTDSRYDYWRIGRIFELLVMSLVKPVSMGDIKQLINRPPFYCEASLLQQRQVIDEQYQQGIIDEDSMVLYKLVRDVNEWRKLHFIQVPSSWLIHQLLIKVFENVRDIYRGKDIDSVQGFIELCYRAFIMIVGACGSVEKSDVFGLGQRVSLIEVIDNIEDFRRSDLYNLNIRPFTELPKGIGSVTRSLFYHPIGRMLRQAMEYFKKSVDEQQISHIQQQKDEAESNTAAQVTAGIKLDDAEESYDINLEEKLELEQQDSGYSENSIEEELEADERLEDLDYGKFEVKLGVEVSDFGDLKLRYGVEQLRKMAAVAGVVFYTNYSMFKGKSTSHDHILSLTESDFHRLDVQSFAQNMIRAGLPKDFVLVIFKEPKRFLSAKSNYRKLTTFLAKFTKLGLELDSSKLG